jgi:hypothetical protein
MQPAADPYGWRSLARTPVGWCPMRSRAWAGGLWLPGEKRLVPTAQVGRHQTDVAHDSRRKTCEALPVEFSHARKTGHGVTPGVLPAQERYTRISAILLGGSAFDIVTKSEVTPQQRRVIGMWIDVEPGEVGPGVCELVQACFILRAVQDDTLLVWVPEAATVRVAGVENLNGNVSQDFSRLWREVVAFEDLIAEMSAVDHWLRHPVHLSQFPSIHGDVPAILPDPMLRWRYSTPFSDLA